MTGESPVPRCFKAARALRKLEPRRRERNAYRVDQQELGALLHRRRNLLPRKIRRESRENL